MHRQIFLFVIAASLMSAACSGDHSANKPTQVDYGFVTQGETPPPPLQDKVLTVMLHSHRTCDLSAGGVATMAGPLPVYPRATLWFAGSDPRWGSIRGFESGDSLQTVAQWYSRAMPVGAERRPSPGCKEHMPAGVEVASFSVGTQGQKGFRGVFISQLPTMQHPQGSPTEKVVWRTIIQLQSL